MAGFRPWIVTGAGIAFLHDDRKVALDSLTVTIRWHVKGEKNEGSPTEYVADMILRPGGSFDFAE